MVFKRILSVVLSICLCISFFSGVAYAQGEYAAQIGEIKYETLTDAVAAAAADDTVVLLADVALTAAVDITKNLTIDLNGHNITATDTRALWVKSGEVIITGTGTISASKTEGSDFVNSSSVIRVGSSGNDKAELTIGANVTVSTGFCYGVTAFGTNTNGVALVVNGMVAVTGESSAISGNGNSGNKGAVTINEGAVVSAMADAAIYHPQGDALTINGGTVTGPTAVYVKSGTLNINGGTLNGTGAAAAYSYSGDGCNPTGDAIVVDNCGYPGGAPTATISGGTFTSAYASQIGAYVGNTATVIPTITATSNTLSAPAGCHWVANGSGGYTLEEVLYVAQIGSVKYETLEAAFAAANATANSTLTLLENANTTAQLEVSGTFTLDLNGKKIEYTGGALNSGVIMVLRGADLTIADSSGDNSGMIKSGANAYAAIALIKAGETGTDAAKLTVNGGTLEGDYYAITGNGSRHGTQITINGGVIRGAHTNDNLGIYHPQDGTLTITGGELTGYSSAVELRAGTLNVTGGTFTTTATTYSCNPNGSGTTTVGAAIAIAQHTTNKPINATITGANLVVPENSQAVKLSISNPQNNTFENVSVSSDIVPDAVVPAGYQWVESSGGNYTLQAIPYVAQVGSVKYETLEAALAAVENGQTVTLLQNIDSGRVIYNGTATFTLDLGGKTLKDRLTINGGNVTIQNGEIIGRLDVYDASTVTLAATATVTGVGEDVQGAHGSGIIVWGDGVYGQSLCKTPTLNVYGTVNNPDYQAISTNGNDKSGAVVNIYEGAVITSEDVAIYQPSGNVNIFGGAITGKTAIYQKSGTLALSGGTITGNGAAAAYSYSGDGCNATGDAIIIDSCGYPGGVPAAMIGGTPTITSTNGAQIGAYLGSSATVIPTVTATTNSLTVTEGYEWVSDGEGNYTLEAVDYVAKIGNVGYKTLEAAFAAAADGDTVTLLADVELTDRLFVNAGAEPAFGNNNRFATTSENKSVTLDLNGYNITTASNIALAGGTLNITGEGTIKTTDAGLAPVEIRGTGDLTAKRTLTIGADVTLEGTDYGLNVFGSNDAQLNKIDVTVNGTVKGTLFVLGNLKNADNDINIVVNGSVIAAPGDASNLNVGIALNGNANVTVNNRAIVSGDSGIEVRCGNLTVNGGTITATAEAFSYTANGSGSTTRGAAIAVAPYSTTIATSAVLNGGTLFGPEMIGVTNVNNDMSNVTVIATSAFTQDSVIPEGYQWVSDGSGNYTLQAMERVSATLTLRENININVYVNNIQGSPEQYTVRIYDDPAADPLVEHRLTAADLTTWGYKVCSEDIYSFQMSKAYYIDVRKTGAGDEVVILGMYEYSVQAYFDHTYDNANSSTALKALCQAGLYYGRAAQQYFDGKTYSDENGLQNYEVGKPINDERLADYNPNLTKPDETYQAAVTGSISELDGAPRIAATLQLGSETSIMICVIGSGSYPEKIHARLAGSETELQPVTLYGSTSQYTKVFVIKNIKSYQLANLYSVEIYDESNHNVTVTYSPYSYARSKWDNENIGNLVRALVVYGNAAKAMGWQ